MALNELVNLWSRHLTGVYVPPIDEELKAKCAAVLEKDPTIMFFQGKPNNHPNSKALAYINNEQTKEKTQMKFNTYHLIERAVEEGIDFGWMRAHKHTDSPSAELLKEELSRAILLSLSEIIDFANEDIEMMDVE